MYKITIFFNPFSSVNSLHIFLNIKECKFEEIDQNYVELYTYKKGTSIVISTHGYCLHFIA